MGRHNSLEAEREQALRHRVLDWLQQEAAAQQRPATPQLSDPDAVQGDKGRSADKAGRAAVGSPAHQKALTIWRKCKAALMLKKHGGAARLNPALLVLHDRLLHDQDIAKQAVQQMQACCQKLCTAAAVPGTCACSAAAAMSPTAATVKANNAGRAGAVAGMHGNAVKAYCSSLYELTSGPSAQVPSSIARGMPVTSSSDQPLAHAPAALAGPHPTCAESVADAAGASASRSLYASASGTGTVYSSLSSSTISASAAEKAIEAATAAGGVEMPTCSSEPVQSQLMKQRSAAMDNAAPTPCKTTISNHTGTAWAVPWRKAHRPCQAILLPTTSDGNSSLLGTPHTPTGAAQLPRQQTSSESEEARTVITNRHDLHSGTDSGSHNAAAVPSSYPIDVFHSIPCSADRSVNVKVGTEAIMHKLASSGHSGYIDTASNTNCGSVAGVAAGHKLACSALGAYPAVAAALSRPSSFKANSFKTDSFRTVPEGWSAQAAGGSHSSTDDSSISSPARSAIAAAAITTAADNKSSAAAAAAAEAPAIAGVARKVQYSCTPWTALLVSTDDYDRRAADVCAQQPQSVLAANTVANHAAPVTAQAADENAANSYGTMPSSGNTAPAAYIDAADPGPAAVSDSCDGEPIAKELSIDAAVGDEVSMWLLRAALLEDELQGRAMEVSEQLQELVGRKEVLELLLLSLQASDSEDHRQPSYGRIKRHQRAKKQHQTGTSSGLAAVRQRLSQELSRIITTSDLLTGRTSALGAALASLQGCQTVLASSRGTKLSPSSRLAVLQLVLGDVAARLPSENLLDLGVLQGLPPLDESGEEICRLVGAGSTAAAAAIRTSMDGRSWAGSEIDSDSGDDCSTISQTLSAMRLPMDRPRGLDRHMQQCQCQQWQQARQYHTTRSNEDAASNSSKDCEDAVVISSVSKALNCAYYTPRPSLAYARRRSSAGTWACIDSLSGTAAAGYATPAAAAASSSRRVINAFDTILEGKWHSTNAQASRYGHKEEEQQQLDDQQLHGAGPKAQPLKAVKALLSPVNLLAWPSEGAGAVTGNAAAAAAGTGQQAVQMAGSQDSPNRVPAFAPTATTCLDSDGAAVAGNGPSSLVLQRQATMNSSSSSSCVTALSAMPSSSGHQQQGVEQVMNFALTAAGIAPSTNAAAAAGSSLIHYWPNMGSKSPPAASSAKPAAAAVIAQGLPTLAAGTAGPSTQALAALGAARLEQVLPRSIDLDSVTIGQLLDALSTAVVDPQLFSNSLSEG